MQARAEQLPPGGDWRIWLILAGRGFGKTRAGAEWVRATAEACPEARIALVSATLAEARAVMVEGESGIIACSPPERRPVFEASLKRLRFPNGAQAVIDGLMMRSVAGALSAPPQAPQDGECYRIAAPATGAWVGRENQLALAIAGDWHFVRPSRGNLLFDRSLEQFIVFDGDWQRASLPPAAATGTTVDAEARALLAQVIDALAKLGLVATEPA